MLVATGLRRDELIDLRFSDIDFVRRSVTVRASVAKSHKSREVPLDDEMLSILADLRAKTKERQPVGAKWSNHAKGQSENFTREHVFVTSVNTVWGDNVLERFYCCCRRAGIEGAERSGSVDIHSLRVTAATLMLDGGANPKAVQSVLGHATLDMTMRIYAKSTERSKREAIACLPFAKVSSPAHIVAMPTSSNPACSQGVRTKESKAAN